jgi:hypothetical protein
VAHYRWVMRAASRGLRPKMNSIAHRRRVSAGPRGSPGPICGARSCGTPIGRGGPGAGPLPVMCESARGVELSELTPPRGPDRLELLPEDHGDLTFDISFAPRSTPRDDISRRRRRECHRPAPRANEPAMLNVRPPVFVVGNADAGLGAPVPLSWSRLAGAPGGVVDRTLDSSLRERTGRRAGCVRPYSRRRGRASRRALEAVQRPAGV